MRWSTLAVASLAATVVATSAMAVDVEFVGSPGTKWYAGPVWQRSDNNVIDSAQNTFGRTSGWTGGGTVGGDLENIIIGAGDVVRYDGGDVGDFRTDYSAAPGRGMLLIRDGGQYTITTGLNGDPDGQWTQIDAAGITVTGAGSSFERTYVRTTAEDRQGGIINFGSWRSDTGQTIELNVLDRATYSNEGQTSFGAPNDSEVITVAFTIGEGAVFRNRGALDDDLSADDTAGAGNEGEINFWYHNDPSTGLPNASDYSVNFTGHGARMILGEQGVFVHTEPVQTGSDGDGVAGGETWVSENKTYQELFTDGLFQKDGGAVAGLFGDSFAVSGSLGSPDYYLADIRGAADGGAFRSDINGDLFVDAADAGALINGLGATGSDVTLANGNINGDGFIDGADAGLLISDFSNSYDDAAEGTAASATATYNPWTGEVIIDVENVSNWYLESLSGSLSGDASAVLPAGGGIFSQSGSTRVGETSFGGSMTYTQDLGALVDPTVPAFSDLTLKFNPGGAGQQDLLAGVIEIVGVPEPASVLLITLGGCAALGIRRRRAA